VNSTDFAKFWGKNQQFFQYQTKLIKYTHPHQAFFFKIPQVGAQVGDQYILSIVTSPNQVSTLLTKAFMQATLGLVMEVL